MPRAASTSATETTGGHGPFAGQRHRDLEARERVTSVAGRSLDEQVHGVVVDLGFLGRRGRAVPAWPPRRSPAARSRNSVERESSGGLTSKYGFSVVAPIKTSRPLSTDGSNASCWALLKRCTSSRNRIVPRSNWPSRSSARCATSRTSLTDADTAERCSKAFWVVLAITWAIVVFPVPGGPQSTTDDNRSASISTRSGLPGPSRCSWPTTSSRVRGRNRAASGACRTKRSSAAAANRSSGAGIAARLSPGIGHGSRSSRAPDRARTVPPSSAVRNVFVGLLWLWLLVSLGIYAYRLYRRFTQGPKAEREEMEAPSERRSRRADHRPCRGGRDRGPSHPRRRPDHAGGAAPPPRIAASPTRSRVRRVAPGCSPLPASLQRRSLGRPRRTPKPDPLSPRCCTA